MEMLLASPPAADQSRSTIVNAVRLEPFLHVFLSVEACYSSNNSLDAPRGRGARIDCARKGGQRDRGRSKNLCSHGSVPCLQPFPEAQRLYTSATYDRST